MCKSSVFRNRKIVHYNEGIQFGHCEDFQFDRCQITTCLKSYSIESHKVKRF